MASQHKDADPGGAGGAKKQGFLLRIPPDLLDELRGWASAELRSLNAQIEYLLREALRRRRGERPPQS